MYARVRVCTHVCMYRVLPLPLVSPYVTLYVFASSRGQSDIRLAYAARERGGKGGDSGLFSAMSARVH